MKHSKLKGNTLFVTVNKNKKNEIRMHIQHMLFHSYLCEKNMN